MSENMSENIKNVLITIYVDGKAYQVAQDDNLLAGVLSNKLNLPYFCWHPSMGSVGACRQCAVTLYADESESKGRLAMACMTPVTDGMRIGLDDQTSADFREQIIGAMMTNHPHDCPVCAEGGECHLQDMTVMTGHTERDYKGDKRTHTNQYLGPHVGHEMNRCITCYRCTRFYNDYAGGKDFGVYGSRNKVYFGRQKDGVLESEFSGNLVEVCPTGVFTDKPFSAHYSRKWDLQSAPSICKGCSVGCNISIGERYGSVRRVVNRYNPKTNGYFLCDRGRYGFSYVNSDDRIKTTKGITTELPNQISSKDIHLSLAKYRDNTFVAIGSPRASLETNTALKYLFGPERFCAGLTKQQMQMLTLTKQLVAKHDPVSIEQIEESDLIVILGEDLTQTAPRIALAVRQAIRNLGLEVAERLRIPKWQDEAVRTAAGKTLTPLYIAQHSHSKLDDIAKSVCFSSPENIALIAKAIDLRTTNSVEDISFLSPSEQHFVVQIMTDVQKAKKPILMTGHSLDCLRLVSECCSVAENTNNKFRVNVLSEQSNSLGLASLIDEQTLSVEQVLSVLSDNSSVVSERDSTLDIDSVLIVENELSNLTAKQKEQFKTLETLISIDHNESELTGFSDVVLPAATFSESQGLLVNYLGHVQCFYPAFSPRLPILPSWRYVAMIDGIIGNGKLDKIRIKTESITEFREGLRTLDPHFPDPSAFIAEQFLVKTARQTHRYSGRTAMMANQSVHEKKATQDINSMFSFSMEGGKVGQSSQMPFTWAPGWNSNQSISKYQQQVNGDLSKAPSVVQMFDPNDVIHTLKLPHNSSHTNLADSNQLCITQTKHIFANDYLGLKGHDFKLMSPIPHLQLSETDASHLGLDGVSHVQVSFDEQVHICELIVTDKQAKSVATLFLVEQARERLNYDNLLISMASNAQIKAFKDTLQQKIKDIEHDKEQRLAQLKDNDQFIPIRLMAGGLDDG